MADTKDPLDFLDPKLAARMKADALAKSVRCPTCGAGLGRNCAGSLDTHLARITLAKKETK